MLTDTTADTLPVDEYRCYCEECEWERYVEGQEAAAAALFGHGIATGHSDTYREAVE